jgi:hypothetical protein
MMKRFISLFLMTVAFGVTTTLAQDNDGKYTLQNGERTMVIDAAKGGKILSLKYGEREVISQLRWPEAFGSTFWTSPQKEWNWPPVPEYDKRPYTVEQKDGVLTLTSEVSERMKYRIRKAFAVDERDGAFVITYTIINESDEVRRVAPWEITRVQNEGGLIFFEAPVEGITPAGLMDFKDAFGAAWYQTDETNGNRKVNADGKGWLAYYNNGLLLVKQFDDLDASQPAPDEAEIQVYVNRGKAHIELESQGAYTTLQPKETVSWTVRWYLQPSDLPAEPSEKLLKQVKKMLKGVR